MSETLVFVILFPGIWFIFGIILLIIGIVELSNRKKKEMNCTSMTYGKVADVVIRHTSHKSSIIQSSYWFPIVEYKIGEQKLKKKFTYATSKSRFPLGKKIEIYYNPEDYNEYYIVGDNHLKTLATSCIIVGIVEIIIALLFAILIMN